MAKDTGGLIRNIDIRQIVELVEAFDRSNLDSLQLDGDNFRLTLGKGTSGLADLPTLAPMKSVSVSHASTGLSETPLRVDPAPLTTDTREPVAPRTSAQGDTVDVRAPIMGLFYAKPDPGSPPFVSVGSEVQEGTTVGLIEVMKVFNAVQAGAKGIVAEICIENGQTVEIGQTLFRIRPSSK